MADGGSPEHPGDGLRRVPAGVQLAADWAWRALVLAAALYVLGRVLAMMEEVLIPFGLALLLTAALWPLLQVLRSRGVHRVAATVACLLVLLAVLSGIAVLVSAQIASQSASLSDAAVDSYRQFMSWLGNGPLHLDQTQLEASTTKVAEWARSKESAVGDYIAALGTQLGRLAAGGLLCAFTLTFFLLQGGRLAHATLQLVPRRSRGRVEEAASQGWSALTAYVRAAVVIAAVDGLGAGLGALALGSNLFVAIGSLTFLCAFIPVLGAIVAGAVATAVVLLTLGWVKAIIMLIVYVAVIELEGHVMQPFLLGRAVSIHPLLVLYGIAVGTLLGGVPGALFAIPLLAFGHAFLRALSSHGTAGPELS